MVCPITQGDHKQYVHCATPMIGWRFGLVVAALFTSAKLAYSTSTPVSSGMGDRSSVYIPSCCVTRHQERRSPWVKGTRSPIFWPGYTITSVPPIIWGIMSSQVVFVYWFYGIHQNTYFTL